MARNIEDLFVRLKLEGFENLEKIKGSFRELNKITGFTETEVASLRKEILEFGRAAGNTEAVSKAVISALQGLRTQADMCGEAYRSLGNDLQRLGEVQRGATNALMAQRDALVATFSETTRNVRVLQEHRAALVRIQEQTRQNSRAYDTLSSDIAQIGERIQEVTRVATSLNVALSRAFPATAAGVRATLTELNAGIELQRQVINEIDLRSGRERKLAATVEERARAEQILNRALTAQRQLTFGEAVRSGREAVRTAAAAFNEPTLATGYYSVENIGRRMGQLPDTTAGLNQELAELSERLANTTRGSSAYVNVAIRMAEVQRQLRTDVMGTSEAFRQLGIAEAGAERRAGKLAGIQSYYATQGPLAPGVGGYRDPSTGAMIAAGAYTPGRIRVNEAAYSRPIGPQPFPETATQALQSVESAQKAVTDVYERAFIQRTELQAKYNQIYIDKALEGLDLEGQLRKREFDTQLADFDRRISAADKRRGRKLSGMQIAQGVGAALSGGIFGGPEGLIGGLGGLALGGVGGAFAGAAAGAQVGMFRQQLAGVTEYSAGIDKLQIALRGIVGSQEAYNQALAAAASVTRDLNIPQETAIQGMTRLSAAVLGAGGKVSDSAFAFRAINEAVKATGGNAEQADGALLALTQVFSKGKVSAEELNQIAERLPGTFTLFAKAAGMTGPELQKALQQGQVGLNDLMKFLKLISSEYGQTALKIAASSQEAGARLSVAFKNMQLEVGRALQPVGASLQSAFADFITKVTPAVVAAMKGLAAAFEFFIENKTASGLATFALQLGAVTAGLIALRSAMAAIPALNLATFFTSTASSVKITGDTLTATATSAGGLTDKLTGLRSAVGLLAKSFAAPVILTVGIVGAAVVIDYLNKLTDAKNRLKSAASASRGDTWLTEIGGSATDINTLRIQVQAAGDTYQYLADKIKAARTEQATTPFKPRKEFLQKQIEADLANLQVAQSRYQAGVRALGARIPGTPGVSTFPTPQFDDKGNKAKDKETRDAQTIAAERQRLANTLLDQQLRAADRVFQHQIELDRQRYELQKRLDDTQAQNRILRETGVARDVVSNFEDLQRNLRDIEERRTAAAENVRLAKQAQQSAAIRATFEGQGAAKLSDAAGFIPKEQLRAWLVKQGFGRTSGDFTNIGHQTPSHMLNAMDMGILGGSDAVALQRTAAMERKLAATGAFGTQLFGPIRDPYGHGAGKGGQNIHLHIPTPGGMVPLTPGLASLMGLQGATKLPTGAATQQNRAIRAGGGAVIESLDVNQAKATQSLIEQNAPKERAAALEQYTLKATEALREQNATMRDNNALQVLRNRLTLEGVSPERISLEESLLSLSQKRDETERTYQKLIENNPTYREKLAEDLATQNDLYAEQARLLRENAAASDNAIANRIGQLRQQRNELTDIQKVAVSMSQTVESSLSTAISSAVTNLVTGAQTIKQTLAEMFSSIAKAFIDMAAQIIAKQLTIIALNAVAKIFGAASSAGGAGPVAGVESLGGDIGAGSAALTSGGINFQANGGIMTSAGPLPLRRYAAGGVANSPQLAVFGERGPEAYVPLPDGRSIPVKMRQRTEALNRYKPISATGTIAAVGDPAAAGGAGVATAGGPIDVRYSVERINNVEYVTAEQFRNGMQQAAAQGAQRGEQRALRSLQQSTSVRSKVGLR